MFLMNSRFGVAHVGAVVLAAGFGTSAAYAGALSFSMTWDASGDAAAPLTYDPGTFGTATPNPDGSYFYDGGITAPEWDITWLVMAASSSPVVDATITVTNTTDEFQSFSLLMLLEDIDPILGGTFMSGASAATVTNNEFFGGDAMLVAPAGGSVYSAFIDSLDPFGDTPAATLFDDRYTLLALGGLATESDSASFAGVAGPAATSSIAVLLTFNLSPGDTAAVTGVFSVVVPGPGALPLMAVFGMGFGRRRRR